MIISKIQEFCIHLFLINCLVSYYNSEFPYIEVYFTDQNSKLLGTGDRINIILVTN